MAHLKAKQAGMPPQPNRAGRCRAGPSISWRRCDVVSPKTRKPRHAGRCRPARGREPHNAALALSPRTNHGAGARRGASRNNIHSNRLTQVRRLHQACEADRTSHVTAHVTVCRASISLILRHCDGVTAG